MDICQSCGMPLSADPQGGGTEEGGSKSGEYCSYCRQNGVFTDGLSDVKEYQDELYRMMRKEQNMPPWKAWLFTVGIPRLKRWKKQ